MEFSNEEWELWTWREVSRALKVSRSWIYANVESGHLPSLRVGGMLRFDPAAIRRFALAPASEGKLATVNAAAPPES